MKLLHGIYRWAEITVEIYHQYPYLQEQCCAYRSNAKPKFSLTITPEDLAQERQKADSPNYPAGYLESLACYRKFCELAAPEGVLLFHSSAILLEGKAYLFAAPSGTGKSTHARLWREIWGERVIMLNDDKPLIRVKPEPILAYGTPWDGKHHLSCNLAAPIQGICFLSQGQENKIAPINYLQALPQLLAQIYRPEEPTIMKQIWQLTTELAKKVPLWQFSCTISKEAAQLAYQTMNGGKL